MIDAKNQDVFQDKQLQDKQLQDKQLLDVEALKAAFMSDMAIIKQILQAFQETFNSFQTEFDTLHQAGKPLELSRLVHGLKGSSANIRVDSLASQAASLQQLIDQKQDYVEAYRILLMTLSRLDQEIETILDA